MTNQRQDFSAISAERHGIVWLTLRHQGVRAADTIARLQAVFTIVPVKLSMRWARKLIRHKAQRCQLSAGA